MSYQREITSSRDPVTGTVYRSERISPDMPDIAYDTAQSRLSAIVWYVLGIIALMLGLRIAFLLFGASDGGFAGWLYGFTDPLVSPFRGIFPSASSQGSFFDSAAFVALIVYSIIAWAISELIELFNRSTTRTTAEHF